MQSSTCEVYKMNPDGSKGEHIKTMPGFPEGWDEPKYNVGPKRVKEEENVVMARADKSEKLAEAKKLIADGASVMGAAKMIGIPQSTLVTWLANEKKEKAEPKVSTPETEVAKEETKQEPEAGCPFDEPIFNPDPPTDGFTTADEEPIPYRITEPDPDPLAAELTKLKLDFANLTLASMLGDTMKLKVIEYILRM